MSDETRQGEPNESNPIIGRLQEARSHGYRSYALMLGLEYGRLLFRTSDEYKTFAALGLVDQPNPNDSEQMTSLVPLVEEITNAGNIALDTETNATDEQFAAAYETGQYLELFNISSTRQYGVELQRLMDAITGRLKQAAQLAVQLGEISSEDEFQDYLKVDYGFTQDDLKFIKELFDKPDTEDPQF